MRPLALLCAAALLAVAQLGSAAAADDAASDGPVLVTCGSVIKLQGAATHHVLHSHEVSYGYGRGSGQQSVTGLPQRDQAGSLWVVRADDCRQGSPIKNGQEVRLQHSTTRRWLHSHLYASPLSNSQEVSCFGDDRTSDTGDVWVIEWDDAKAQAWTRDAQVRLRHRDTGAYLANHNLKYQRPIPGHTEVMALKERSAKTTWLATEGVYFAGRDEH